MGPAASGPASPGHPGSSDAPLGANGEPTPADTRGARRGPLDAKTARAETKKILAEVATARNLKVTREVKVDVVDRDGIRTFAEANMYEHTTPEEIAMHGRIESSLGALPMGANAETVLLDMLEDGVLGFYDPKRQTLFIGDFVSPSMLSQVVGHEIAHGLQDMHFDLNRHMQPMRHRGDAEQARRFLIEGGAQAAYFAWVSGEDGLHSIDDGVLDAMANQVLDHADMVSDYPILVRNLQMPYTDGTATVVRLVRDKGWGPIDALYDDMPQTTEQMLHLDKLLANEGAYEVTLDAESLSSTMGMKATWHDELGEATLLAMLAEVEPSVVARRAAAGWAGDVVIAFDDEPRTVAPAMIGAIAWDSKGDAIEFLTSFEVYLNKAAPQGTFAVLERDVVVFGTHLPASVDHQTLVKAATSAMARSKSMTAKRRKRAIK